jgi:hypothetical protein
MSEHLNDRPNKDLRMQGKVRGQKPPLKMKEIWAIRVRLQLAQRTSGLPSSIYRVFTSTRRSQSRTTFAVNSLPLSERM